MSEILKSRHAFGSEANIQVALEKGLIDAYDILFLKEGKIGWIDAEGNPFILEDKAGVVTVDALPEVGKADMVYICKNKLYFWDGTEFVAPIDEIGISPEEVDNKIDAAIEVAERVKYEITSKPVGTLVNYGEKEIRVMCPADTQWVKQNVGATGDANKYYMGFRAYAPEGAVGYKEGTNGIVEDEMFTFDNAFAGTDDLGRNYSIVWLALASYDEATDTWSYYGAKSTAEKYLGFTYAVEWYDENGIVIEADCIRINLSNEDCHSLIEPYYVSDVLKAAKAYTDEQVMSAVSVVEF